MPIQSHPFITNRWFNANQNYIEQNEWFIAEDNSSFAFVPNPDIKSIFLGTFPTHQICGDNINNGNVEFFYGSNRNQFWPCLGSITNMNFLTFENRVQILRGLNIGITDILKIVNREPWNCDQDTCLTQLEYNDILALIRTYPTIRNIFMTSGGRSPIGVLNNNNRSVATWLRDSMENHELGGFDEEGFVKQIIINEIQINLVYLYSPSGMLNGYLQGILNNNNNFGIVAPQIFRKIQWAYFLNQYHFDGQNIEINNFLDLYINEELTNFFG